MSKKEDIESYIETIKNAKLKVPFTPEQIEKLDNVLVYLEGRLKLIELISGANASDNKKAKK